MIRKPSARSIARDITYAYESQSRFGRQFIRFIENMTGRIGLIKKAEGYADEVAAGANFWQLMFDRYDLELEIVAGSLENIPSEGPVIIVSNHPFGILDGVSMGYILSKRREKFKIMANRVFRRSSDLDEIILPISFEGSKDALAQNIECRKEAISLLDDGGIIGIFPGATVSTSATPMGQAFDPSWQRFPTKLLTRSSAIVVPIYFEGHNSRLFQIVSHFSSHFRLGLLIGEFRKKSKRPVRVHIGKPISRDDMQPFLKDAIALKSFLRTKTYGLGGVDAPLGYEFDERYREKQNG